MTPLEELQAAHKRLSELRAKVEGSAWSVIATSSEFGGQLLPPAQASFLGDPGSQTVKVRVDSIAAGELVTVLHRTIDAQLAVLSHAIETARSVAYGASTAGPPRFTSAVVDVFTLRLARAINGGAS